MPADRWKPCKKCGSTKDADTICSRCGGSGMVTGYGGDPTECFACGYSGIQYPPVCPDCCGYRARDLSDLMEATDAR